MSIPNSLRAYDYYVIVCYELYIYIYIYTHFYSVNSMWIKSGFCSYYFCSDICV